MLFRSGGRPSLSGGPSEDAGPLRLQLPLAGVEAASGQAVGWPGQLGVRLSRQKLTNASTCSTNFWKLVLLTM